MTSSNYESTASVRTGLHGQKPALQVICLGNSGGPCEENVTGFLVRSVEDGWQRGSTIAVDAGSHLAPIIRILERDFPSISDPSLAPRGSEHPVPLQVGNGHGTQTPGLSDDLARTSLSPTPSVDGGEPPKPEPTVLQHGPFAGLKMPHVSARANALHVLRSYISTYLITHPHLDHLSGFAINTAAFHATSKPKTLAALPSTVDAVKRHIFNDVIWPNLTDEDGGVGFVTFQRLKEGGDVMVGEGEGRGYIDVVDGLGVRAFKVSHGVCTKSPPSHHHRGSVTGLADMQNSQGGGSIAPPNLERSFSQSQHSQFSAPATPGLTPRQSFYAPQQPSPRLSSAPEPCVVDSTAYFIRDGESSREVLIFGDVEPDSISLSPRNRLVWQEAARKIAHGLLGGIFIESSYDDTQADAILFGHLNPRHLIAELQTLATLVLEAKAARAFEKSARKRKRSGPNGLDAVARHAVGESERKRSSSATGRSVTKDTRRGSLPDHSMSDVGISLPGLDADRNPMDTPTGPMSPKTAGREAGLASSASGGAVGRDLPLHGIKVVIIHIKDTLRDGPHVSSNILADLRDHEARLQQQGQGLGCEFIISQSGESYWF
ncbi:hypothetical protein D0869_05395 [Hortaea werneckii]|uniref:3',5'-cyclic-nucleotide phosphodiesterase n=1 Tax=Hortaea werneckii TaxID=91943 RepID=A0A3M6YZ90_HORWE|nr:hypothetical protein KC324_g8032 [Hortaea werneckii]KAI7582344.1 hypothetical protein KC316_g7915 [Hortaea werneckii]RMX83318.1 hypothetical protein D0869_05395 [Hortaea werneckii]RMY08081.1 hypothetical protein D0868_04995 [Hortaea werneckii]